MDGFKKVFEELRKQPVFVRIMTLKIFQDEIENEMKLLEEEFGLTDEKSLYVLYMKSAFESMLERTLLGEQQEEPEKEEVKKEPKKNNPFEGLKLKFKPDGTIDWEDIDK